MLKSMTAYSRASRHTPIGHFVVELHSVNRKTLDVSVYLPKQLLRFDVQMRQWLSNFVERGQVTIRVSLRQEEGGGETFSWELAQLKNLKKRWEIIAKELGYSPEKQIDFSFLVSQIKESSVLDSKEEEEIGQVLQNLVQQAGKEFVLMKETEGEVLRLDIEKRLEHIEEKLTCIESVKEEPLVRYKKKLHDRLKELIEEDRELEERILREVALLAEKMDITEELVRMRSHLKQFKQRLHADEKTLGKTLDFLTQEMHRETNTLGAKCADSGITVEVIGIKAELEKVREQVQNIE